MSSFFTERRPRRRRRHCLSSLITCLLLGLPGRLGGSGVPSGAARKLGMINSKSDKTMATDLTSNCMMLRTNTSNVKEISDQKRRRNEVPGIHRPNCPCLCWKPECCKATWRNWRERRGACTHCSQLNEYPTLPTPPLPARLSPIIFFHISSRYQFIFVYSSFENLILHIFLIIILIIRCSGMFHVPCSIFLIRSTAQNRLAAKTV